MKDNRSFPHRPFLTPVFTTAILFWGSCAFTFSISKNFSLQITLTLALIGIATCLLFVYLGTKRINNLLLLACAVILAGASLASAEAYLLHAWHQSNNSLSLDMATITLLQDSSDSGFLPQALARVETRNGETLLSLVTFPEKSVYLCGQSLTVKGSINRADYSKNDFAWRNGVTHIATVTESEEGTGHPLLQVLIAFRSRAIALISSEDSNWAILQALVCGYRASIKDGSLYASYQSCGLAHLVAVSGAHLVIVTGFVALLLKRVRIPRKLSLLVLVTIMCLYVIIAGIPLSAVRAAIMSTVAVLSYIAKRRPSSLNALGVGIYAIVGTCPHAALSASLVLSALSAMGIIIFAPLAQRIIESVLPTRIDSVATPLALTFSAALPAQLYSCALFSQLPIISPVSNLFSAPLFPLCCGLGLLGVLLSCISMPFGSLILELAHLCTALLNAIVVILDGIPYGTVPISIDTVQALALSLLICRFAWLLWERIASRHFLISIVSITTFVVFVALFSPKPDCIAMLDVGQGDSFLIRSSSSTLLIDTGNKDSQLLDQLARLGVCHLDAVLITHSDDDHSGSLDALNRAVDVDTVLVAKDMLTCKAQSCTRVIQLAHELANDVKGVQVGDCLQIGKFNAEVLWPQAFVDDGGNADSVVLAVHYDEDNDGNSDLDSLFTGDAEHEQIEMLVERGAIGKVDILKVGHHGSANGLTRDQALLLEPSIALIGVGENNRYGHPSHEILDYLTEVNARIFRSDQDGGVILTFDQNTITAHGF